MAYFRITPGTQIVVRTDKAQYEIGETVNMTIEFSVDAKEIGWGPINGWWTIYADVYIEGRKYTTGGDQKMNEWGSTETASTALPFSFVAENPGIISGYVVAKAKDGI